jgi:hypothetical protein
VLHQHDRYDVEPSADMTRWGGGWLTDLALTGALRVAPRFAVTGSWLRTGEGNAVMHHTFVFSRQRITAGVTYAR